MLILMTVFLYQDLITADLRFEAPPTEFSNPRQAVIDGEWLYVLDTGNHAVDLWDMRTGTHRASFGSQGEGPGEFAFEDTVGSIAVTKDYIVIVDDRVNRVHYWARDWTYSHTQTLPGYLARVSYIRALPDGNLLISETRVDSERNRRLILATPEFEMIDIVFALKGAPYTINKKGGWLFRPYAERIVYEPHAGGIWLANSHQSGLLFYDGHQGASTRMKLPLLPAFIEEEEKKHYRDQFRKWSTADDQIEFPEYDSAVDDLFHVKGLVVALQRRASVAEQRYVVVEPETRKTVGRGVFILPELAVITSGNGYLITIHGEDREIHRWRTDW